jgi:hypothetical protein
MVKIREEMCGNCPHQYHKIGRGPHKCSWHTDDLCKGSCDNIGLTQEKLNTLSHTRQPDTLKTQYTKLMVNHQIVVLVDMFSTPTERP